MLKVLTLVALSAVVPAFAEDTCSATASAAARVHAARTTAHDSFTLTYFNGRGLAEIPRTIFATAGVFPAGEEGNGFTDVRLSQEEFENLRNTGDLAKNL